MSLSRRCFLRSGAAGVGLLCLGHDPLASRPGSCAAEPASDRVLVLLQLSGGNDGLSTIVPWGDDAYGLNRSTLRIPDRELLKIDDYRGFHPKLSGFRKLWDAGQLAVVEGAGYPEPNRSHFKSLDIWHAASARGRSAGYGWVGRLADVAWRGATDPNLVIHVGNRIPFSLHAAVHRPVAFTTPQAYRWIGAEREIAALEGAAPLCEHGEAAPSASEGGAKSEHAGRDAALARLRRVLREAQQSSELVREAARSYQPATDYPRSRLAASLVTVAALLKGGLSTRVYSVEMGGFDTHTTQRTRHDNLMSELGDAVAAFFTDLAAQGQAKRVVLVAFSEFGRRVRENASRGTDHGVAGPMFVIGPAVKGGLHGKHPSLERLDDGDLVHTTDFRSVYAALIDSWIQADHREILGRSWKPVPLIRG